MEEIADITGRSSVAVFRQIKIKKDKVRGANFITGYEHIRIYEELSAFYEFCDNRCLFDIVMGDDHISNPKEK